MAKRKKPREAVEAGDGGDDGDSACFSDAEEESWHSPFSSNRRGGSGDRHGLSSTSDHEIGGSSGHRRDSSVSDCCSDVDLESGVSEIKVHLAKVEKDCRICHLGLESGSQESGVPIELGCSCKDDLAAAHRQCAEAWFKIRGNNLAEAAGWDVWDPFVRDPADSVPINRTCEICGSTARNIVGATEPEFIEQWNETSNAVQAHPGETRSFWHGHRFLNFLLACMIFAFVISWLFHFNVPS